VEDLRIKGLIVSSPWQYMCQAIDKGQIVARQGVGMNGTEFVDVGITFAYSMLTLNRSVIGVAYIAIRDELKVNDFRSKLTVCRYNLPLEKFFTIWTQSLGANQHLDWISAQGPRGEEKDDEGWGVEVLIAQHRRQTRQERSFLLFL
jgi:hypothetical protein